MSAAGLIFSNIHDSSLPELTARRTMGSVPFGCRYRLIDFPLSNMVNAGISKVGVVTHNNYQSLMDHIGTGKDWDLARRSGGIKLLPPFITAYENSVSKRLYNTRLEALIGVSNFISRCSEEHIVFSDSDIICNIDIADVIRTHEEKGADITIVSRKIESDEFLRSDDVYALFSDFNGRVSGVTPINTDTPFDARVSMNIIVVGRLYLIGLINEAISCGYTDFYRDIIARVIKKGNTYEYCFDGIFLKLNSLESYFSSSMRLLEEGVRKDILGVEGRPIYTKVRNSAPTLYKKASSVKNSFVADGCVIEGEVENSIIFRGVKIGKGSVVKNSILLQGTFVGNNVRLGCVISDKDVIIKDGRELSGHKTMPFFISKGRSV